MKMRLNSRLSRTYAASPMLIEKRDRGRILQTWSWKSPRQRSTTGAGGTSRAAVQVAGTYPTVGKSKQRLI